jgi:hypothetical protein
MCSDPVTSALCMQDGTDPRNGHAVYVRYASQFTETPARNADASAKSQHASKQGTSVASATHLNAEQAAAALGIGGSKAAKKDAAGKPSKSAKKSGDVKESTTSKGGTGMRKTGKIVKRKSYVRVTATFVLTVLLWCANVLSLLCCVACSIWCRSAVLHASVS